MVFIPAASVEMEKVATPLAFSGLEPIWVAPSIKVTVPVGVMEAAGETVTVKVTS